MAGLILPVGLFFLWFQEKEVENRENDFDIFIQRVSTFKLIGRLGYFSFNTPFEIGEIIDAQLFGLLSPSVN